MTGVWADLIGQERLVALLAKAVAGDAHAMTHAWLFTGPPGSGRSNAAKAFAAALQCRAGGCGKCNACLTTLSGAHPDITLVRTEALSIGVKEVRDLVRRSMTSPATGRFQIIVVEDADRVTERGADALLKAIEEPAPRTIWLLCAPNAEDVVVTIRSRCRLAPLTTPSAAAIAQLLQRDGVNPDVAEFAARVSQGHVGRARALARDEGARNRRLEVLRIPAQLLGVGDALTAAAEVVDLAAAEAQSLTAETDAAELAKLSEALGITRGRPRSAAAALKELEEQQDARRKRLQRDALDRVLTELTSYYRDVLVLQTSAGAPPINPEVSAEAQRLASRSAPEATLAKLDAILACRNALEEWNVAPLLAMESLLLALATTSFSGVAER